MAASDRDKSASVRSGGPPASHRAKPASGGGALLGPALIPLGRHADKPPILLKRPAIVIGSRSTARIHLVSKSGSRAHALLIQDNGVTYIRDLASRTGVKVNDQAVRETVLRNGDRLAIGSFLFQFAAGPDALNEVAGHAPPPAELAPA